MSMRCRPPSNSQGSLALGTACGHIVISKPTRSSPGVYFPLSLYIAGKCHRTVCFSELFIKTVLFLFGVPEMGKCEGALFWKEQEVWNTAASSVLPASGRATATALSRPGAEHGTLCDLAWVPVGRVDPTGPGTLFFLGDLWLLSEDNNIYLRVLEAEIILCFVLITNRSNNNHT